MEENELDAKMKLPPQPKTTIEASVNSWKAIVSFMIIIFFLHIIIGFIQGNVTKIIEKEYTQISATILFNFCFMIWLLFLFIRKQKYICFKNSAIKNGIKQTGEIVNMKAIHHSGYSGGWSNYIAIIRLNDGRNIESIPYNDNLTFYKECTVYFYKSKYILTDFR